MVNLCEIYKNESLRPINDRLNQLEKEKRKVGLTKLQKEEINIRINKLNWHKSNLEFGVYWMEHAHPQDEFNGIDNLKAVSKYIW
jgi:uncharacterized protein involved in tellurium resistance